MARNRQKQRENKRLKKEMYTRLSGIMKGIVVRETEINELHRLMEKYPEEIPVPYA